MDAVESVKMAVKTLTANKLRSSLTMLGMIIGNASVIAMIGIGQGMQTLASEQFESLGPNVLFVSPGTRAARNRTFDRPNNLVLADADAIATQVPLKGLRLSSSLRPMSVIAASINHPWWLARPRRFCPFGALKWPKADL
jgi:ABC-type antimicrobial peptide transport system permease subunit